jgi:hypothetical protein
VRIWWVVAWMRSKLWECSAYGECNEWKVWKRARFVDEGSPLIVGGLGETHDQWPASMRSAVYCGKRCQRVLPERGRGEG